MVEGDEVGGVHADPSRPAQAPLVYHSRAWHALSSVSQIRD
jgi:hypothetical protein